MKTRRVKIAFGGTIYEVNQVYYRFDSYELDKYNGEKIQEQIPNLPYKIYNQLARFVRINPVHIEIPPYIKEEEREFFELELWNSNEYVMRVERLKWNPNTQYFFMGLPGAFFHKKNAYRMSFYSY